jgi:hypothetical protein
MAITGLVLMPRAACVAYGLQSERLRAAHRHRRRRRDVFTEVAHMLEPKTVA